MRQITSNINDLCEFMCINVIWCNDLCVFINDLCELNEKSLLTALRIQKSLEKLGFDNFFFGVEQWASLKLTELLKDF